MQEAYNAAGHLIEDRPIQQTTALFTTYGEAYASLAARGIDKAAPDREGPADATPVWMVTFKGVFYKPPGPGQEPSETPRPRELHCSEIVVLIDDSTDPWGELTLLPAASCS